MIRGVTRTEGAITIFHLRENLSPKKVKPFIKKLQDLIDSGRTHVVLDLSSVNEICVMGLVSISSIFNKCRSLHGAFKVCSLTPEARKIFRDTNLINTIEVFDTPLEALKSFHSENLLRSRHFSGSFYIEEKNAFVGWDRLPARNNYLN